MLKLAHSLSIAFGFMVACVQSVCGIDAPYLPHSDGGANAHVVKTVSWAAARHMEASDILAYVAILAVARENGASAFGMPAQGAESRFFVKAKRDTRADGGVVSKSVFRSSAPRSARGTNGATLIFFNF